MSGEAKVRVEPLNEISFSPGGDWQVYVPTGMGILRSGLDLLRDNLCGLQGANTFPQRHCRIPIIAGGVQ